MGLDLQYIGGVRMEMGTDLYIGGGSYTFRGHPWTLRDPTPSNTPLPSAAATATVLMRALVRGTHYSGSHKAMGSLYKLQRGKDLENSPVANSTRPSVLARLVKALISRRFPCEC